MDQKWNTSPGNWGKPYPTWDAHHRMGPLLGTPQAPPENPEGSTAAVEREAVVQPLENGNLEDGEQRLLIPLEDVCSLLRGEPTQANESA